MAVVTAFVLAMTLAVAFTVTGPGFGCEHLQCEWQILPKLDTNLSHPLFLSPFFSFCVFSLPPLLSGSFIYPFMLHCIYAISIQELHYKIVMCNCHI